MKLIQCRYSSGQRVPLLVQTGDAAPLPMLVPFIYVQLKLRYRAYNTSAAHLRAIQAFYTYAKTRDLDIDEAILACHFDAILALLDGYAIWLQSGRHADNLIARIGTAATAPFPYIDPRTRDQYLRLLKQYLSWSVTRYIPRARQNSTSLANIEVAFADVAAVIERRFESHIINAQPDRTRYRSLTDTQLQIIRTLIRPGTTENPFPERLQLRNWLMLEKNGYSAPPKAALPLDFQDFCKALIVYLQRTRSLKFSMVAAYNIAIRRLYNPLFERGVSDPTQLTRGDFDRVVGFLRESGYKNLYDAVSHLQVIADTIDNLQLTEIAIHFEHGAKPEKRRHDYISLHDPDRAVKQRKSDDRLPSREAMEAYALCSNNPLSEGEEILLRVIDLLIATGQRGNEVAVIPYDSWVERPIKGTTGEVVVDANGKPLVECGIRYFAEKQFQSRVHWFAESDVPLARRAVERLKVLTQEQRGVCSLQFEEQDQTSS